MQNYNLNQDQSGATFVNTNNLMTNSSGIKMPAPVQSPMAGMVGEMPVNTMTGDPIVKDPAAEKAAKQKAYREKYKSNPYFKDREDWAEKLDYHLPNEKKSNRELLKEISKRTGIDPGLIYTSAMEEGMKLALTGEKVTDRRTGYINMVKNNPKDYHDYPIDGGYFYGLNTFGDKYGVTIKRGLMPQGFNYKPYKEVHPDTKEHLYTSGAFKSHGDALSAKGAMMRQIKDRLDSDYKKNNINLSPNAKDFFEMVGYNMGEEKTLEMIKSFDKKGYLKDDKFLDEKFQPESWKQPYTHVQRRWQNYQIMKNEGYFDDMYDNEKKGNMKQEDKKLGNKEIPKYAFGGDLRRPSSRQRNIVPLLLGGASMVMNMIGAKKQRKAQEKEAERQRMAALANQYGEQKIANQAVYNEADLDGEAGIEYYAKGGSLKSDTLLPANNKLAKKHLRNTPKSVTLGGYTTLGGKAVQIGDGVEEIQGNLHNQTKIDGVSGVQLHSPGEGVKEVEDKEIIVDGHKVLSNRLMYDNKKSYADKMREIVKKRNKLEKDQDKAVGYRGKNSLELKLAGLNMAEEALFAAQEEHKIIAGRKELENTEKFAIGGDLTPILHKPFNVMQSSMPKHINIAGGNAVPIGGGPSLFKQFTAGAGKFLNSGTGQAVMSALPGIVEGIGAIVNANKTPKLPTPLLNAPAQLETRVNVNPQLANIRGTVNATVDNIMGNSSNSNNVKANIGSIRMRGAEQESMILNNKENQELNLRNADAQHRQSVAQSNNATMNNHAMAQYQRQNDIRSMRSAGYARIAGGIQTFNEHQRYDKNFKGYMNANLADDKLGEKINVFINDPEYLKDPANVQQAVGIAETKDAQGNYKFPLVRERLFNMGLLTKTNNG